MNSFRKNPFIIKIDDSQGCIISDNFTVFPDLPKVTVSSSTIDIVEITDAACDARYPGQWISEEVNNSDKNISSSERIHQQSRIPRLMKSYSRASKSSSLGLNNGKSNSPMASKLPVPVNTLEHGETIVEPSVTINEKAEEIPETPENFIECNIQESRDSCGLILDDRKYQKARGIGARIGKKISSMVEHVKKKQRESNISNDDSTSISIVKKILRRDVTRKNHTRVTAEIYPQFYIGSTPSELKLFRLGDEWTFS